MSSKTGLWPIVIALVSFCCIATSLSEVFDSKVTIEGQTLPLVDLNNLGGPISLGLKKGIVIRSEAQKGAGYLWSGHSTTDAVSVQEVSMPRNQTNERVVGAPEPQYFLLRGNQQGSSTVIFHYGRPQAETKPIESLNLTVKVE